MESPSATSFFSEEIEKAKQNPDPIVRQRVEELIAKATAEWNSRLQMVSVISFIYLRLLDEGLVKTRQR